MRNKGAEKSPILLLSRNTVLIGIIAVTVISFGLGYFFGYKGSAISDLGRQLSADGKDPRDVKAKEPLPAADEKRVLEPPAQTPATGLAAAKQPEQPLPGGTVQDKTAGVPAAGQPPVPAVVEPQKNRNPQDVSRIEPRQDSQPVPGRQDKPQTEHKGTESARAEIAAVAPKQDNKKTSKLQPEPLPLPAEKVPEHEKSSKEDKSPRKIAEPQKPQKNIQPEPVVAEQPSAHAPKSAKQKKESRAARIAAAKKEKNQTASAEASAKKKQFAIQYGAFPTKQGAEQLERSLKAKGISAYIVDKSESDPYFKVRSGSYKDKKSAERSAAGIRKQTGIYNFVTKK